MVEPRWPWTEKEGTPGGREAGAKAPSLKVHGVLGNGGCGVQGPSSATYLL